MQLRSLPSFECCSKTIWYTWIHTEVVVLELGLAVKANCEADSSLPADDLLVETLHFAPLTLWSRGTKAHTNHFSNSYCTIDSSNSMEMHNTLFSYPLSAAVTSTFINKPSWWSRYFSLRVSPYSEVWIKTSLSYWQRDKFDVAWSISLCRHILTQCIWVLIMTLEDVGKRSNPACGSDFAVISYFLHNWQQILGAELFLSGRISKARGCLLETDKT